MYNAEIIHSYFPELSSDQRNQFNRLGPLYADWNQKINVISRKDINNFYLHHVLHSLSIAKVILFKPGATILDVGTGGGFPGIPLAVLFPDTHFYLVDSIGKKIMVVKDIIEKLGLKNVEARQIRAEEVSGTYDFIVSRAVARMKEFYGWTRNKGKPDSAHTLDNGILYLKGGEVDEELSELKKPYAIYTLSDYFKEDFFETKKLIFIPFG